MAIVIVIAGTVAGYLFRARWVPQASQLLAAAQERLHDGDPHAADDASMSAPMPGVNQGGNSGGTSLELSEQAQKNVGLQLVTVEPRDFDRTINVPAMVKHASGTNGDQGLGSDDRHRDSHLSDSRRSGHARPTAVRSSLTHEDLVDTQSAFLETIEQLDVIKREVARLEEVTSSGAIAGKRLLERQYEQQQTEARLRAQQQALILHGITEEQVDEIKTTRRLLQQVTVFAPQPVESSHERDRRASASGVRGRSRPGAARPGR